jgi:hypothetical protein
MNASLDGFWTYVVPGTNRGGLVIIRSGVVLGGDNVLTFRGALVQNGSRISMAMLATRFNHDPTWDSVWGVNTAFYAMRFEGEAIGEEIITGKITREDVERTFDVEMTRRGPAP